MHEAIFANSHLIWEAGTRLASKSGISRGAGNDIAAANCHLRKKPKLTPTRVRGISTVATAPAVP